jgi:isopentenyl phosphate kinase
MKDLYIIKLGGSLITDKNKAETARFDVIKRLAKEIHEARQEKDFDLIVGHGGGSFPHRPAYEFETKKGFVRKDSAKGFALVQDAASRLNRIIVKALINAGENAVSMQPGAWCITKNGEVEKAFLEPFKEMLGRGLLPVPFGDAVMDSAKGSHILSTEQILEYLGVKLKAKRIIVAGNIDGVFTGDPHKEKGAKLIPEITKKNYGEIKSGLQGSESIDVTGGMHHKVEIMLKLAGKGIESVIINGEKDGNLKQSLLGKKIGTAVK